jgi:hypothetical protein
MLYLQNSDSFLPTGDRLCPRGGCRIFSPTAYRGGITGLLDVIVNIASLATYVIAALSVLFIIYAAFLFLVGGDKGAEKGRKVIINSIIAVIIAAVSFTAIQLLVNILNEFRI